jgi:hypothetical protein
MEPRMSMSSPGASDWIHLQREVEHQARIEAAFDRADGYGRVGDFARALAALDEAGALSGGLPPSYRFERARLAGRLMTAGQ